MVATLCRTWCICHTCHKRFSVQNSDYKKRLKASKSGNLFCCKPCQAADSKGTPRKRKDATRTHIESYLKGIPAGTRIRTCDVAEKIATTQHSKHANRVVGRLMAEYTDKVKHEACGWWVKL